MSRRIVLVGGSGMLGSRVSAHLQKMGYEVVNVSRSGKSAAGARGVGYEHLGTAVDGALAVVNLAGANIGEKRWTNARRRELTRSRLEPTRAVVQAILDSAVRGNLTPPVLVNLSGISYYGNTTTPSNEGMGQGKTFLAQLSAWWEAEARKAEDATTVVILRMAPVLELSGGPLGKLLPLVRSFLGGVLGSGNQYMPWIHVDDAVQAIVWAATSGSAYGVYNVTAPEMITMREFVHAVGQATHRPIWLRVPEPLLYLALGTMADTVDDSTAAYPMRLLGSGFSFAHPAIGEAVRHLVSAQKL